LKIETAFPGKVRGTADPSASLGMTKERGDLSIDSSFWTEGVFHHLVWATTFHVTTNLPFVIPSEAEGSAVPRTLLGYVFARA